MLEVTLREFSGDLMDCETLVQWRNENSSAFPDQEPWTVGGQQSWYRDIYIRDPSLNLYFVGVNLPGQSAKCLIGTVGMRIKDGVGEMMWMILGNKNYARGGYMRRGMRMLMEAYGLSYYWGRVMPDNIAGLKFQLDNGFQVISTCDDGMLLIARHFDGTWPERSYT